MALKVLVLLLTPRRQQQTQYHPCHQELKVPVLIATTLPPKVLAVLKKSLTTA
jgi:hypothetical protein